MWYNIGMEISNSAKLKGRYRFRVYNALTGELKRTTPWTENLIVSSDGHGLNLITRALTGINTYPLEITQAKIGTGTNSPTLTDTDLQTVVLDGIIKSNQSISNNTCTLEFFISDLELANDTYTEFGLFAGDQLFARSLITPTFTKSANEDATCDYELTFTSEEES